MPEVIVISGNPPFSGNYTLPPTFGDNYSFGDSTPCNGFLSAYECSDENTFESVLMHFDKRFTAVPFETCDLECRYRYDAELWFQWVSKAKKLYTGVSWNYIANRYQTQGTELNESPASPNDEETIAVASYNGETMLQSRLGNCYLNGEPWMKHRAQARCEDPFLASSSSNSSSSSSYANQVPWPKF